MLLTPATIGVNVRTIGTKRASTMVLAPCLSKNAWALSTFYCLKSRLFGRLEERPARPAAEQVADLVADDRGEEAADEQRQEREVRGPRRSTIGTRREEAGGEEQRVAGEEEADEQTGLGEDDGPDAEQTDLVDQFLRIERAAGRHDACEHRARLVAGPVAPPSRALS